ncbi:hypothetical protein B0H12DRAFT_1216172 [Mycena haematopus]|nr:hypothetical protein B0H12DRAFT_1216172 [Mycena haematopus]
MLSDSETDEDVHQLTINEHYAKAFEYKKEREELQRLKEQYGSDPSEEEETDSEDLESEDSDGEELTLAVDAAILRTLARIKAKDPEIYEEGKDIFGEEQEKTTEAAKSALSRSTRAGKEPKDKGKPFTLRAANLQNALLSRSPSPSPEVVTHAEEQRRLRDETIAAFHAAEPEAEDDEDDILVPREKTEDEIAREEEEYRRFLESEVGDLRRLVGIEGRGGGKKKNKKKNKEKEKEKEKKGGGEGTSGKSKQQEDQDFLVNYILNRGWIDRSSKRVPTYGEVTSQKKEKAKAKAQPADDREDADAGEGEDDTDEEEVFDDIVDRFESSYNFRFEEADGSEIKTYPRTLPSLVRREDTTRKDARERRRQRKEEELAKRKEEVRRLKGLKVKEIRARLERAGVATGGAESLQELGIDLDAPWDPEAHDRQMASLYALNGGDAESDEEGGDKPVWEDVDIGDIPMSPGGSTAKVEKTKKKKEKKKKKGTEDDDGGVDVDAMDADALPARGTGDDDEEWDGTEEMRKRKLDEWMDEVYALDFNDIVGGQPTRFHYTSVAPQKYGLSPVEILLAKDTELNEYMSVKKYAPYRAENKAGWDRTRNERLKELKGKVHERLGGGGQGQGMELEGAGQPQVKKRKGKKERMKEKEMGLGETKNAEAEGGSKRKRDALDGDEPPEEEGKKKRRRKKKDSAVEVESLSPLQFTFGVCIMHGMLVAASLLPLLEVPQRVIITFSLLPFKFCSCSAWTTTSWVASRLRSSNRLLPGLNRSSYAGGLGNKVYRPLARQDNGRNADEGLELVLGIKQSGTSHLLLTRSEKNDLFSVRDIRVGGSQSPASDFESLSPILFRNVQELEAKLGALQPKPKSTRDDSKLNKAYQGSQSGIQRGQFENARVFYRVLRHSPTLDKRKFDLVDTSWTASVRVFSFTYNVWLSDTRSLADRRLSPKILDVAWCEASTPTLKQDDMKAARHLVYSNNQNLRNPVKKEAKRADGVQPPENVQRTVQTFHLFFSNKFSSCMQPYEYTDYGQTQFCDPPGVAEKVQEVFGQFTGLTTREPVVLLVHNEKTALDVFKSLGIDTSHWDFSLKNLLRDTRPFRSRQAMDPRGNSRRRSASPRRGDDARRRREPSPPPRQYAPVYVVDVQSMFSAVFNTSHGSESVPAMLERMSEIKEMFAPKGWCAGNECWMLLEVFRQMVERSAIDEQRNEWIQAPVVSGNQEGSDFDESDYGDSD